MIDKKDKYRLKVGISVDREIKDKSDVLRDRFNINISSLCRSAIVDAYDRMMESKNPTGGGAL